MDKSNIAIILIRYKFFGNYFVSNSDEITLLRIFKTSDNVLKFEIYSTLCLSVSMNNKLVSNLPK